MIFLLILTVLVLIFLKFEYSQLQSDEGSGKTAGILCCMPDIFRVEYVNIRDCGVGYSEFGNSSLCEHGCLGLKTCVVSCPQRAIREDLSVEQKLCNGCGICVETCPVNLIVLNDPNKNITIECKTTLSPEKVREICSGGCVRCYLCLDVCEQKAIYVEEGGLPVIDKALCNSCFKCVRKCPTETIKAT